MSEKTLHVVQHFEKQGRRTVAGRAIECPSADEAMRRAERDHGRMTDVIGVVAVTQTIDTESGEVLGEPVLIAQFGQVPEGIFG